MAAKSEEVICADPLPVADQRGPAIAQWRMVVTLTLLCTLAYIDKNVIVLMLKQIQSDLGLSAVQVSLAIGSAFAIANVLIGIPAGWIADRYNRKLVIWGAVSTWSAMTMLCGFATSFLMLFTVRAGVGLAEGMLPPSALSLIRDGVAPQRRARAFGTFTTAAVIGTGVAFLLGGALVDFVIKHPLHGVPILGEMPPWAVAVAMVGAAGLPLSLLAFTIKDPGREAASDPRAQTTFKDTFVQFAAWRRIMIPLAVFSVTSAMLTNSVNLWFVSLLTSRFGLGPSEIGFTAGLQLILLGPVGMLGAGYLVDRLNFAGRPGAPVAALLASAGLLLSAPALPFAPTLWGAWASLGLVIVFGNIYQIVTSSIIAQTLTPRVTGKAIAVMLVMQGLIGVGIGPTITAFVSEHFFNSSPLPILMAMATVHTSLALVGIIAAIALYRQSSSPRSANNQQLEQAMPLNAHQ